MNKKFYAILGTILILVSCVGGDKDSHGCITSAGYTWCQVQERCVRLWEDGVKMEDASGSISNDSAKFNSYLLFASDSVSVELFDTKMDKSLILKRTTSKPDMWSEGAFSVKKISGKWIVMNGDNIVNIEVE